jgi:5-methyltetrahydrofolate--homocysteine methyltransferase
VVVLGTVEGEYTDIGKDMVSFMLEGERFQGSRLGGRCPVRDFVEAVSISTQVVGLSGLLTVAYDAMKKTVDALAEAGFGRRENHEWRRRDER